MNLEILGKVINSDDFTVGGGSASAIAGSMAAGIVSMVCKLSMNKPVKLTVEEYESISKEADELAKQLLIGADDDTKAYCMIKDAYAMPKNTDEEKKLRTASIREAGKAAASVPRDNGYKNKRVNELALLLVGQSNEAASSDLYSALYLSDAGVKGCILNIEANLSLIKDEKILDGFKNDIEILKGNK
ncbi:MAG: formiminotransferase-cyclodeaminase [Bacillota bacterium]|jgi:formiminotetrahydrofolate cyclodeaminase|nr:formiminotransferase-cyclodeaminase [Bacillota bacterium]